MEFGTVIETRRGHRLRRRARDRGRRRLRDPRCRAPGHRRGSPDLHSLPPRARSGHPARPRTARRRRHHQDGRRDARRSTRSSCSRSSCSSARSSAGRSSSRSRAVGRGRSARAAEDDSIDGGAGGRRATVGAEEGGGGEGGGEGSGRGGGGGGVGSGGGGGGRGGVGGEGRGGRGGGEPRSALVSAPASGSGTGRADASPSRQAAITRRWWAPSGGRMSMSATVSSTRRSPRRRGPWCLRVTCGRKSRRGRVSTPAPPSASSVRDRRATSSPPSCTRVTGTSRRRPNMASSPAATGIALASSAMPRRHRRAGRAPRPRARSGTARRGSRAAASRRR